MMSFIDSMEYIMQGSGVQALFELIYAEEVVRNMVHGKEISRVTQTHTLIYTVLYGYFAAKLFESNLEKPCNDGKFIINSTLQILKKLVKDAHENTTSCTMQAHIITILIDKLSVFSNATTSKTVTLWIQYSVDICIQSLRSSCTRDWQLYLDMSRIKLVYFASLGEVSVLASSDNFLNLHNSSWLI